MRKGNYGNKRVYAMEMIETKKGISNNGVPNISDEVQQRIDKSERVRSVAIMCDKSQRSAIKSEKSLMIGGFSEASE